MRIMGSALTGMAVALTGMLVVCAADPAAAAGPQKSCKGKHQALENGQCVDTQYENPDRGNPVPMNSYRSQHQKSQKKPKKPAN